MGCWLILPRPCKPSKCKTTKDISIFCRLKPKRGEKKKAKFQRITYRLYIWKVVRKSNVRQVRYNDKLKSLECGRIVPPSRWDGPDRLPMEVRSQHDKTYELFLSLRTMKSLHFWSVVRKFLCDLGILSSSNTMRNPSLETKFRQRVSQHRISRHRLRKCLGSSEHSCGVIPLSLYGTYGWGHSPALTNQNYIFKMTP